MQRGINLKGRKSNDDKYYTPSCELVKIGPYIPEGKVIWEAFTKDDNTVIESPKCLRDMGHQVIATGENFWTNNHGDMVISNPPYSTPKGEKNIKVRIIERLIGLDKPFMLCLPTLFVQTKIFRKLAEEHHFQLIVPTNKIQFYKIVDGRKLRKRTKNGLKGCSFYTLWVCWKLNLKSDLVFI